MCGIVAYLNNQGVTGQLDLLPALDLINHRGPDSRGSLFLNNAGLGHCRLSIMDPENGHQPMSYLKIHSVVNGELYDYENIKSTLLSEHTFNCNSDSEIVTRLYVKYGTDFVRHLRGEFAIIIYDEPKNKLIVVRDRFGIKPVFYTYINGRLVIASEIKAFMGLGWKAEWDVTSLKEAGYFVDNRTVFKNVFKLAPASYMIANSSSMTIKPYYEVTFPHKFDQETRSLEEMILGVRSRLKKAVELRLRSDVPVGIYLSGGIDSSAILGLTTTILREKDPNAKVVAFTISFVDGRNIQDHSAHVGQDEGDIAERMAEFWNADFHKVDVDESDLAGNLEDAIYACENPYWDLNGVAKFILSKRVQDYGIKVVLTGEGSDEHFAGYSFFKPDSLREQDYSFKFQDSLTNDERVAKLSSLESGSNPWSKMSVVPLSFEDMQIGRRMLGNVSTPRYLCSMFAQIPELFKSHSDQKESTTDFVECVAELFPSAILTKAQESWHPLHTALYVESRTMLPNLLCNHLGDRNEMAHSIEARTPFLDHEVTEYVNMLPPSLKMRWSKNGNIDKWVLREAMKPYINEELYLRIKHPFIAPPAKSIDSALGKLFSGLSKDRIDQLGWMEWRFVEDMKRQFMNGDRRAQNCLLNIFSFVILSERFNVLKFE